MAILDEFSDRGVAVPLGVGLLVAAVSLAPKLVKTGRPMIKRAIKGYLVVHAKSREMFAETAERMQDLYAEAKHEFEEDEHEMKPAVEEKAEEPVVEESPPAEGRKPRPRRRKRASESEEE